MRKGRIFLIIAAVLVLAIGGAIVYVLTNINSIVKAAIEKYGSQATKTDVRVSSVEIGLSSGEASITRLTVANPRGFSTPNIFSLGNISTRIAVKSVTETPIVIQEVRVSAPEVFYEMTKSRASNLDVIKKNLSGPEPAEKEAREKKAKGKEVRLFIRKLVIEKGRVEARIAALGEKPIMLDLPRLELTDIGKKGGATPTQVAKTVVTALAEQTAKAVARQGEKHLKKGAEGLLKRYMGK